MPKGPKSGQGLPSEGWCTICDREPAPGQRGFAVAQDRLGDRLSIFHREDMTATEPVHYACSPAHAQELVIHWMITGNLDYPFAEPIPGRRPVTQSAVPLWAWNGSVRKFLAPISELAIDREAVQRLLRENPAGLEAILEELYEALQRSIEDPLDTQDLVDLPENLLPHI